MRTFSDRAILIKRIDYGDTDLIITFFTKEYGKLSVMAKAAKKSIKRFGGILQLFSVLNITGTQGDANRMIYLQEATVILPIDQIKSNLIRTAYANYWSEILNLSLEEKHAQKKLYMLFEYSLKQLDDYSNKPDIINILFQSQFLYFSGLMPELKNCVQCKKNINKIDSPFLFFIPEKGGIICPSCRGINKPVRISKGSANMIIWISQVHIQTAKRIVFSKESIKECLKLLEIFIPYCLGKTIKSLAFINKIRGDIC